MADAAAHDSINHGISLAGIRAAIDMFGGASILTDKTTSQVCTDHVLPATASAPTLSFCEARALAAGHAGKASVFVSHAWAYPFLEVVAAIEAWESSHGAPGSTVYYWFDLFSNCQHSLEDRPFTWWSTTFQQAVGALGHTLLVLRWSDPIPLRRSWCLWEITCTLLTDSVLEVIMPPDDEAAFRAALTARPSQFDDILRRLGDVHTEKAECMRSVDQERIAAAVADGLGFAGADKLIAEAMRRWMADCGQRALDAMPDDDARATNDILVPFAELLYAHLDRSEEARTLLERARVTRRRVYGDNSAEVYNCLVALQSVAYLMRDIEAALGYAHDCIRVATHLWGETSAQALNMRMNVASALLASGKGREALDAYLSIEPHLHLFDTRTKAVIQENTAVAMYGLGDIAGAMPLAQAVLEARTQHQGPLLPQRLRSLYIVAAITLTGGGDLVSCETAFREAVSGFQKIYGDEHGETLTARSCLASALWQMGRHEEAYTEARDVYARLRADNGSVLSPSDTTAFNALLSMLQTQVDACGSRERFLEVMEVVRQATESTGPAAASQALELDMSQALALALTGSLEEAWELAQRALEGMRAAESDMSECPKVHMLRYAGMTARVCGKTESARALLQEAYARAVAAFGAYSSRALWVQRELDRVSACADSTSGVCTPPSESQ